MSMAEQYLKEAFAGESQANRKYLAFAEKADQEGYPQVARMFRAAAEAETIHAHNHLRALKGIRSTKENLREAISGETHEFTQMYPEMIEAAKAEKHREGQMTFYYANEVEKVHAQLYEQLLVQSVPLRRIIPTMSARCAAIPLKKNRLNPAPSAEPRESCSRR